MIRHGASLLRAFAAARVPKVTVVLRKAYGGAVITMNSKGLGADLVFAWPGAEIGIMAAGQAVGVVHRRRLAAAGDEAPALRERLADAYAGEHLTAGAAATSGFVDEVIEPRDTRACLVQALALRRRRGDSAAAGRCPCLTGPTSRSATASRPAPAACPASRGPDLLAEARLRRPGRREGLREPRRRRCDDRAKCLSSARSGGPAAARPGDASSAAPTTSSARPAPDLDGLRGPPRGGLLRPRAGCGRSRAPDGDLARALGLHRTSDRGPAPGSAPGSSRVNDAIRRSPPNTARPASRSPATPASTTPQLRRRRPASVAARPRRAARGFAAELRASGFADRDGG